MPFTRLVTGATVALALAALGCKGGDSSGASTDASSTPAAAEAAAPAQPALGDAVTPTGTVHEVKMTADPKTGGRFEPNTLTVKPGDVVKFTLVSGAHNVHFLAEKNPGVKTPNASDILQLPGQTYELLVGAKPGTYSFQCDPHAALGMIGTLTVQ